MRPAFFDSDDPEMYYDNPNLILDDPSYLLEPGDPGYVPPFPTTHKPHQKMKKIPHQRWFPSNIAGQIAWLINFRDHIGNWTTKLGLTPTQVTAVLADCNWLIYVLETWLGALRTFGTTGTQTTLIAQTGDGTEAVALPAFNPPAPPTGTVPQLPGALLRIFDFVQILKRNPKCDDAIANDLQIVGSEVVPQDLTKIRPKFTVRVSGYKVFVDWSWDGLADYVDSIRLEVDRNDGKGFVLLTIDTTPGYTDTQPFPPAKAVWTYRGIYRANDDDVGVWSDPVSIAVGA